MRALAALLLASLAGLAGGAARGTPAPAACAGPAKVLKLPVVHGSGVLRGDVDGDGRRDVVTLRHDASAPTRCRFLVVVATRHRALAAPFDPVHDTKLALLARAAPRGLAVVVEIGHGASTGTAMVFVVSRGRLQAAQRPGLGGDQFFYGGSVTHFEGVTCSLKPRSGMLVVGAYFQPVPSSPQVEVDRTFYRLEGAHLVPVHSTTALLTSARLERRNYPEFREPALFPTCTAVATKLDWH